jgi:hypothetical protein
MNWPNGEEDPIKVITRIFETNLSRVAAWEVMDPDLVWAFIRQLRLVERDELVHLTHLGSENCFIPGTRIRDPDFWQMAKSNIQAGRTSASKKLNSKKGVAKPTQLILNSAKVRGHEGRTRSGKFIVLGAVFHESDVPFEAKVERKSSGKRASKKKASVPVASASGPLMIQQGVPDTSKNTPISTNIPISDNILDISTVSSGSSVSAVTAADTSSGSLNLSGMSLVGEASDSVPSLDSSTGKYQ